MLGAALTPFRSVERSYLGRRNQMVAAMGLLLNSRGVWLYRCGDGRQRDIILFERLPGATRAPAISSLID
jgi:hypothetical protein